MQRSFMKRLMIYSFWYPAAIGPLSQQFAARRGFAIALQGSSTPLKVLLAGRAHLILCQRTEAWH